MSFSFFMRPSFLTAASSLEAAERSAKRIRGLFAGGSAPEDQVQRAEYALQAAELAHQRAVAEFEGVRKILELSVREAEIDVAQAEVQLDRLRKQEDPQSDPASQHEILSGERALSQKQLALQRVRTLLEIHLKSVQPADSQAADPSSPSRTDPTP